MSVYYVFVIMLPNVRYGAKVGASPGGAGGI